MLAKKVLLVEDDWDIRETLIDVLVLEGYDPAFACNGEEAVAYLQTANPLPDIILLDLMMPVMDGEQFRAIQTHEPKWADIPVIVLSADSQGHRRATAMAVAAFIRKPIGIDGLLKTVSDVLQP